MHLTSLLFSLAGCLEYGIGADPTTFGPTETSTTWTPPTSNTGSTTSPELCNGEDDDGDGAVDEDFPDTDGDGMPDCADDLCSVGLPAPRQETDAECTGGEVLGDPPANPWNWTTEWTWKNGHGYSTPTVGDLDGDGIPEVVFTYTTGSIYPGELAVVDGSTGITKWTTTGNKIDSSGGVALGDIDGDGLGDIVTYYYSGGRTVVAFDHTGHEMWTRSSTAREENYPVITDLEGDGDVEVIANELVLDGATGSIEVQLSWSGTTWGGPAVADLDLDGVQEIMLEQGVFRADGSLWFTCGTFSGAGTFPQPVNVDEDPEGEVFITGYRGNSLCDDDGTLLWTTGTTNYGTPTAIADFDGDGLQEFAFAQSGKLTLLEGDGSTLWSTNVDDTSGLAGTTSWDINLDGVPEVVYADEEDIMVFDGATGTVVVREPGHNSVTLAETPAVADVDGDGQGELLYLSNGSDRTLTVVGGAEGDWPYSPPVYNQYTYYGVNINYDLSVPKDPDPPWIHPANIFRGQPSALYISPGQNLKVEVTGVCIANCSGGYAEVAVQVWNDGGQSAPAGTDVEVWSNPGSGAPTLLTTLELPADLSAGDSWEIVIPTTAAWLGSYVRASADARLQLDECDELDNEHTYLDVPCQ